MLEPINYTTTDVELRALLASVRVYRAAFPHLAKLCDHLEARLIFKLQANSGADVATKLLRARH